MRDLNKQLEVNQRRARLINDWLKSTLAISKQIVEKNIQAGNTGTDCLPEDEKRFIAASMKMGVTTMLAMTLGPETHNSLAPQGAKDLADLMESSMDVAAKITLQEKMSEDEANFVAHTFAATTVLLVDSGEITPQEAMDMMQELRG